MKECDKRESLLKWYRDEMSVKLSNREATMWHYQAQIDMGLPVPPQDIVARHVLELMRLWLI